MKEMYEALKKASDNKFTPEQDLLLTKVLEDLKDNFYDDEIKKRVCLLVDETLKNLTEILTISPGKEKFCSIIEKHKEELHKVGIPAECITFGSLRDIYDIASKMLKEMGHHRADSIEKSWVIFKVKGDIEQLKGIFKIK
jgi:hypothetical protein